MGTHGDDDKTVGSKSLRLVCKSIAILFNNEDLFSCVLH